MMLHKNKRMFEQNNSKIHEGLGINRNYNIDNINKFPRVKLLSMKLYF